jgi:hypothetical protein
MFPRCPKVKTGTVKAESEIEKLFLKWYREFDPATAYLDGMNECAGRFLVPSRKNLDKAKSGLKTLAKKATNQIQRDLFRSYLVSLEFNEPYMVPSRAATAFFTHLVKEGIVPKHIQSLAAQVGEALDAYSKLLKDQKWSVEIKILTCQTTDQLLGILETILAQTKSETVKEALTALKTQAKKYRKLYAVEGIRQGDFDEIYPIIKKQRGKVKHKKIYPEILADLWGYPETHEEIEQKGKQWLKRELPLLQKVTRALAKSYRVKPNVETVEKTLGKRKGIPRQTALQFVKHTRSITRRVFEENIIKITSRYDTRVVETPPYLVSMIPSAAMLPFDGLAGKPFNIFFITTDPHVSSSVNVPELVQSILHEEYGHAVNYSNSVTKFAANPTMFEIISSAVSTHISDGISFHRELEFAQLLRKLSKQKKLSRDEKELLNVLKGDEDTETMILENEFIVQKWRIMRFLRAIFDVRINMEKESVADFIERAHKETGLSEKMIFYETWGFLETVGYAPCYSIAGDVIRRLQQKALKSGVDLIEFNTYVSSLGFPPRKIFEQRTNDFIKSHS